MSSKRKTRRRAYLVTLDNLRKECDYLRESRLKARDDMWRASARADRAYTDALHEIMCKLNTEHRKEYVQHVLEYIDNNLREKFLQECLSEADKQTERLKHHLITNLTNQSKYHMDVGVSKDTYCIFNITTNPISVTIGYDFTEHLKGV